MNIEKIALFIDGPNFYFSAPALGLDVDFKRLLAEFERRGFCCAYNGYTVVIKLAKEFDDDEGRRKFKRNIAVELAVDALE
jgi:uncharacterized LabA/DUF88 family protein